MFQELLLGFGTDARNGAQFADRLCLAAPVPVMRDAEAVRFVPDLHQHAQGRGIPVEEQRQRIARHDDLFQTLGQSDDIDLIRDAQFHERFQGKPE